MKSELEVFPHEVASCDMEGTRETQGVAVNICIRRVLVQDNVHLAWKSALCVSLRCGPHCLPFSENKLVNFAECFQSASAVKRS